MVFCYSCDGSWRPEGETQECCWLVGSSVTLNCAGTNLKWDEFISDDDGAASISSGSTN